MTKQLGTAAKSAAMRKAARPGGTNRSNWLRGVSSLAAAIALAGVWSPMAQAQISAPSAHSGTAAPHVRTIAQRRVQPEIRSIASAPYMADARIRLDTPVLPVRPPVPTSPVPPVAPPMQAPAAGPVAAHGFTQTISAAAPTVVALEGPTPLIAPRVSATQSAQGSFSVASGTATITRGAALDQVQIASPQAIINWTTLDTATRGATTDYINFLPQGTALEFVGNGADYTVLNRIFGTPDASGQYRGIAFEGAVTSRLSAGGPVGGNVWFYAPGGILLSNTASFNVGSLVLSASNIDAISGSTINFTGVTQADAAVLVDEGASISALNQGSYIALVGPRVEQAGTVTVNGSAAYVGAEQAQLTISNGLFDIAVSVGTDDANGVVHSGTTTGVASQAVLDPVTNSIVNADAQGIFMVAVPKNTALTMLVGGTIGYQAATGAALTENGTIILSAGAGIDSDGGVAAPIVSVDSANAVAGGNVSVQNATFTSDTQIFASQNADLSQSGLNSSFTGYNRLSMGGDGRGAYSLDVAAGRSITMGVANSGVIDIAGNVSLRGAGDALNPTDISMTVAGRNPGPPIGDPLIPIPSDADSISIGGDLTIDTSASGRDDFFTIRNNGGTGIGEDAVAGDITVNVTGLGSLIVGGNLLLDATAQGGKGEIENGSATGGNITFRNDGGTVDIARTLTLNASAFSANDGEIGGNGAAGLGADSTGGNVSLILNDTIGSETATTDIGAVVLASHGYATEGSDQTIAQDNVGTAGNVNISVTGGAHSLGSLTVLAQAVGATSFLADGTRFSGSAIGGAMDLAISGAGSTLNIAGNLDIDGSTEGRLAAGPAPTFNLTVENTELRDALGALIATGGLIVDSDIQLEFTTGNGDDAAVNIGRNVAITANNSNLEFGFLSVSTQASNNSGTSFTFGGSGVDFQAGDITLAARNGGAVSGNFMFLSASASGADTSGGNGTGGVISLIADNGRIGVAQFASLNASGFGGGSLGEGGTGTPGIGQGGTVRFDVSGTDGQMALNSVFAQADGAVFLDVESGGPGFVTGDGGSGIAGDVVFNIDGGLFTADSVEISASGTGGAGGEPVEIPVAAQTGGAGGEGLDALAAMADLEPDFAGAVSGLPRGGTGGDGVGGDVTFNLNGGITTVNNLTISATGEGGQGAFGDVDLGFAGGHGGNATGGTATFNALAGTLTVTGTLSVNANANSPVNFGFGFGSGGDGAGVEGGNGGAATGGTAVFNLNGSAVINAGNLFVSADAYGGQGGVSFATFGSGAPVDGFAGGNGGGAIGGTATFNSTNGTLNVNALTVSASGLGGNGGGNFGFSTGLATNAGGNGGDGTGGTATVNLNQDDPNNPTYTIIATGTGGNGGTGLDSGSGGNGAGGIARLNVNNVDVSLSQATLDVRAAGGQGGIVDGEGGLGGNGGNAVAGHAILDVNGANAVLNALNPVLVRADGTGGNGAEGGSVFTGGTAGNGGAAGSGTGGIITLLARDGADASLTFDTALAAQGYGGTGGGGGSDFLTGQGADGGAAGDATGGRIELLARTGGSLTLQPLSTTVRFDVSAIGADGGNGGTSSSGVLGALGANGDATGGSILISADGAGSTLTLFGSVIADASAEAFQDTRSASLGGDGTGALIDLAGSNGAQIIATGDLLMAATARGGQGWQAAGNAVGGIGLVTLTGAAADIGSLTANFATQGGNALASASPLGGNGADGGDASGASFLLDIDPASSLRVDTIDLQTIATGGDGGNASGSAAAAMGGNGGAATAGNITLNLDGSVTDLATLDLRAFALGGSGGAGQNGGMGGTGGNATGGTAALNVTASGSILPSLTNVTMNAGARAGAGGAGAVGDAITAAGTGGAGGTANGGSASIAISGNGASLVFNPVGFTVAADALGGDGGAGGDNSAGTTGMGGAGGNGTGGTVTLQANSGTTLDLSGGGSFILASSGRGGAGGRGGNANLSGLPGGAGGNGGIGRGGSPTLRAVGGTIIGSDLQLTAVGTGGNGGGGGDDGNGTFGAIGNGGNGEGGTPLLELLEGSPGIMSFANVDLIANGAGGNGAIQGVGLGGLVTMRDLSTDPLGLFEFASLDVDASGLAAIPGGGFVMTGGSGATTIAGNLGVNVAGDIRYDFDGNGQMVVGGNTVLDAGGSVTINHTNNSGPVDSFSVAGTFGAQAGSDFLSTAGSRIAAGGAVNIRAEGNAQVRDVAGVGAVRISAGRNATVHNASATGAPVLFVIGVGTVVAGPALTIDAGSDVSGSLYDPAYNARVTGTATSTGTIAVNAGGNAVFASGSATTSDNGLFVRTGDDIIIESGASVIAAANPATAPNVANPFLSLNNLALLAGDITALTSTPLSPLASIVSDGTINANDFAVVLSANAIDASGGTVIGSSIAADINDAPSNAVLAALGQSDDNGLLSGNCAQGNICFGNVQADNQLLVGQASNNGVLNLFVEQGTVNANVIAITTRNSLVMGTNGIATTLNAANQFSATSTEGDVDLRDAAITSGSIQISAAGSLLGSASLVSTGDIGIDVGGSLNASQIETDGQLTNVADMGGALETDYAVNGDLIVDTLSIGAGPVNYTAGGSLIIDTLTVAGTDVALAAGGLASLGTMTSGSSFAISGSDVFAGLVAATGDVLVDAGNSADLGQITAGAALSVNAGGVITANDLAAGTTLMLDGSRIAIGSADAATIGFASASDIAFDSIRTANSVVLATSAGAIGRNGGAGSITTTNAGAGITVLAGGASGDIDLGVLTTNGGDILLSSARDLALTSAATGAATPASGSIAVLAGRTLAIGGTLSAGEDIAIQTPGAATLANLTAGDDVLVRSTGALSVGSVTARGTGPDLRAIQFNPAMAGQAGAISFAAEIANGANITLNSGAGFSANGTLNAARNLTVEAVGNPVLAGIVSGGDTRITGAAVTLDSGTIGGALTLTANSGAIRSNGTVSVGGAITLNAATDIGFGALDAQNGAFTANAGGDIVFATLASGLGANLVASGLIDGDRIDADGAITLAAAGSISVDHAEAGTDFTATAGGNFTTGLNSIITGGDILIQGDVVNLGNSTAGGLIDVTGTQIDFVNLIAGSTVALTTVAIGPNGSTGGGNLNIAGVNITAGPGASAIGSLGSIAVTGTTNVGGSLAMDAASTIGLGTLNVTGGQFTAVAGETLTAGSISATGSATITADQGINVQNLAAADALLTATNGAVAVSTNAAIGGLLDISANSVLVRSLGNLAVRAQATAGGIAIETGGNLETRGLSAAGNIFLTSGGSTTVNQAASAMMVGPPATGSTGTQQIVTTNGGNITITAATDILISSTINAAANLSMSAGNLIDIQAIASGAQIDTLSADMAIGANGQLGRSDLTNAIAIRTAGNIQLGNAGGSSTGFIIDNAEFSRIFSGGDLSIIANAGPNGGGNISVGDLAVAVGTGTGTPTDGNFGIGGTFLLQAEDSANFTGNLTISNAAIDTAFTVTALNQIFIDADTATVRMQNASAAPTGIIGMSAARIIAASSANLAAIAGLSFDGIEDLLGQAATTVRTDGYIFGSDITFSVDTLLAIQNSAAATGFADRRGIVADSLTIQPRSAAVPITPGIIVNGIVGGASGVDAVPLVTVPAQFDPLSTVNGCLIANPASCVVTPTGPQQPIDNPLQDLIDDQVNPDSPLTDGISSMVIDIRRDPDQQDDPLLDEPVTGAGNEDLWIETEDCSGTDEECELEAAE